jgi:hypothetical protein
MPPPDLDAVLETATVAARRYLGSLPDRQVYRPVAPDEVRALVDRPLPDDGLPPEEVVADLARDLEPYVAAHASGRYFGFVVGGLHPAAYGAELLVSTWDQNAAMFAPTPGVAAVAARISLLRSRYGSWKRRGSVPLSCSDGRTGLAA